MNNKDELIISNNPELLNMMEKSGIDRERYIRGIIFAENIVNGENANDSYSYAFEVSKEEAKKYSANLRKAKWIEEIILFLKPSEEALYFGETRAIIRRLMKIIDNSEDEKEVISAARALHPYINNRKNSKSEELEVIQEGKDLIQTLIDSAKQLASENKMITPSGEIIDVPILK